MKNEQNIGNLLNFIDDAIVTTVAIVTSLTTNLSQHSAFSN